MQPVLSERERIVKMILMFVRKFMVRLLECHLALYQR
jgi:hypothetical protein